MLRRSVRLFCSSSSSSSTASTTTASAATETAAAAASTSAAASASASAVGRKMYTDRRKKDYRWPQLLYFVALYGLWRFLVGVSERMHGGHQFLPIYSESGELEGFTHPVLVDAAESIRKRNEAKAAQ